MICQLPNTVFVIQEIVNIVTFDNKKKQKTWVKEEPWSLKVK